MTSPLPAEAEPRGRARLSDLFVESVRHVVRRPLRSFLTALTSSVAIAVTVNVISLSYGLDEDLRRDVRRFGLLTVDVGRIPLVAPGTARASLGPPELLRVEAAVTGLRALVVPRRQAGGTVTLGATDGAAPEEVRVPVLSAGSGYLDTLSVEVAAGRWLSDADRGARVLALDAALARRLFPGQPPTSVVGRTLSLTLPSGAAAWTVVGVLGDPLTNRVLFDAMDEGRNARTLTSGLLSFRNLYLPDDALGDGEFSGISLVFPDEPTLREGADRLSRLWPRLGMDPAAMRMTPIGVFVRRDWMAEMNLTSAQGTFIGNIVWIVIVLVAAVMLSTLHLITIRERYDELAVRRCEGARRADVGWQVTLEGVLTALVGGLLGLPLGQLAAQVLRQIVDVPFRFEAKYALAATGVAVLLGLVASVVPARRAARLDPARILTRRLT
jgi:putative ABC transport system permease protein